MKEETHPINSSILHCMGLILLLWMLMRLMMVMLGRKPDELNDLSWLELAILSGIPGLLTAQAGAFLVGLSIRKLLRFRMSLRLFVGILLAAGGLFIFSSDLATLLEKIQETPRPFPSVESLMKQHPAGVLFLVAFVVPLSEEVLFRGVMLEDLKRSYRTSMAMVLSSLLFALVHFHPWAALNAFLLGMFFCWVKLQSGSLSGCILLHSTYNALPFIYEYFRTLIAGLPPTGAVTSTAEFTPLWLNLLAAGCLGIGLLLIATTREQGEDAIETCEKKEHFHGFY